MPCPADGIGNLSVTALDPARVGSEEALHYLIMVKEELGPE